MPKIFKLGKKKDYRIHFWIDLLLTEERIEQIVDGIRQLIDLEDPIGETI